jgi:mono/diheme cytochrome c family protein
MPSIPTFPRPGRTTTHVARRFARRFCRTALTALAAIAGWILLASPAAPVQAAEPGSDWKLPADQPVLAPGAGRELALGQCILCHSTDYISTQPRLTRAQWQATVDKMRVRYGAPVLTNQAPALVDYLTAAYGRPTPAVAPVAPAGSAPGAPGAAEPKKP